MPRLNLSRQPKGALFIGFVVVAALAAIVMTSQAEPVVTPNESNTNVVPVGGGEVDLNLNSPELNTNSNENTNAPGTIAYDNTQWGVKVQSVEQAKETISGDITTIDFGGKDSLSILSPDLEGIVRESIGGVKETTVTVGGVSGMSITGASAKDGSQRTLILVETNNRLFVFDGSEEFLNSLSSNVEFVNI